MKINIGFSTKEKTQKDDINKLNLGFVRGLIYKWSVEKKASSKEVNRVIEMLYKIRQEME
jgi:hypothetical protein